jgi:hypothetical protein
MKTVVYRVINKDRQEYELFGEFSQALKRRDELKGRGVPVRLERKEVEFKSENWIEL